MKMRTGVILALAGALAAMPLTAGADANPPATAANATHYTKAQLDQMLAPIALYPDQLLTQILMASTYPLEVVEADRWVKQPDNAALSGDALAEALQSEPWDPSVKSLAPFPQVLHMMDDNLTWTEQLGDAFLSDQKRVMDSVQDLRRQAQAAGKLRSTQYDDVTMQGSQIVIVPAAPDVVYVPVYDPLFVYGAWPYPDYPPFFFGAYFDVALVGGFGWFGFNVVQPLWGWGDWDWDRDAIFVNRERFDDINVGGPPMEGDRWHHDPFHRHGVPYPSAGLRERFRTPGGLGEMSRFRGYPLAQPPMTAGTVGQQVFHPMGANQGAPARGFPGQGGQPRQMERRSETAPPAFESYGRSPSEIRRQSQRGYTSRHSMPMQAPRNFAPQGGFGGGFRRGGGGGFRNEGDFGGGGGFGGGGRFGGGRR